MGLTVVTDNGGIIVSTSQKVISSPPSGWDEQIAEYGRGYNYPTMNGQDIIYRVGDDADIEASLFAPIRVENSLKVQNSLIDYLTLGNTNIFGNTLRFTDSVGGQIFGAGNGSLDNYVIDNYTGLGWYISNIGNNTWNNIIDNSLSSNNASFSDWFLPSIGQLDSINEYGYSTTSGRVGNSVFELNNGRVTSSSTYIDDTTKIGYFTNVKVKSTILKSTTNLANFICRKHY